MRGGGEGEEEEEEEGRGRCPFNQDTLHKPGLLATMHVFFFFLLVPTSCDSAGQVGMECSLLLEPPV